MKNKKFSRARAMALTLSLSALPISAFAIVNSNTPVAYAEGGMAATDNENLYANLAKINQLKINTYPITGVRIFLAPAPNGRTVTTNGSIDLTSLDRYRRYAFYEFYAAYDSSYPTALTALSNKEVNAYEIGSEVNNRGYYPLKSSQVHWSSNKNGEAKSFDGLIPYSANASITSFKPWEYGTNTYVSAVGENNVNGLQSIADWANATFTDDFDLDAFLANYKAKVGKEVFDNSGLPQDSTAYSTEQWSIIVEPVLVCFNGANYPWEDAAKICTFSYQEYFCPLPVTKDVYSDKSLKAGYLSILAHTDANSVHGAGGLTDNSVVDKSSYFVDPHNEGHTCVAKDSGGNASISTYMFQLKNLFAYSESEDGIKFGDPNIGGRVDKGGIGFYGNSEGAFRSNIEANLNRNITLISDQLKPSGAAIRADRNTGDNPYFANTADDMSQADDKLDNIVVVQGGASQQDLWVYNSNLRGASKNADGLVTTLADISSKNMWNAHQNELNNLKFLNKGSDGSKPLMTADTLSNANRLRILKEFSGLNLDGYSNVDTASDNVTLANLHMVETVSATYNSGSEGGLNINDVAHQMDLSQYRVTPTLTPLGSSESVLSFGSMIGGRLERVSSDVTSTVDGVSSNADAVDSAGLEIINKAMSGVQGTETADKNTANAHFVVPPSDTVDIISPKDVENIIGSEVVANINDPTVGAILSKTNGTLKKGKIYGYADGEGKKSGTGLGLGITLQTYIPKNEVSSYVTYIHRDENGDISISRDTTEYTYDATSSGVVPFDKAKFWGSVPLMYISIYTNH